MGAVFLAERADGEFQRQVALKIVGRTFAGEELLRRFRRERQIHATLNHPHIAHLLDGGVTADGEPFFVMEYVDGLRIDEYCARHDLPLAQRLSLFVDVCRAVAHAHEQLVIHRDLKPSNILVTCAGVPKLLDFGIARVLGDGTVADQTLTEHRAFTPEYASPEQARGASGLTPADRRLQPERAPGADARGASAKARRREAPCRTSCSTSSRWLVAPNPSGAMSRHASSPTTSRDTSRGAPCRPGRTASGTACRSSSAGGRSALAASVMVVAALAAGAFGAMYSGASSLRTDRRGRRTPGSPYRYDVAREDDGRAALRAGTHGDEGRRGQRDPCRD